MDPVVAAAASAGFGFVYIHPFSDGNGRLHRWLIHHVLAAAGYNPPELVFPLAQRSCAILMATGRCWNRIRVRCWSLLSGVRGQTENIEVLDDTADFYR
jgi:hypothetical protein